MAETTVEAFPPSVSGNDEDESRVEPVVPPPPAPYWRHLRVTGLVVVGLFFLGLVAFSTLLYQHFVLSADFATYNQAWTLIGHGHLDPVDSLRGFRFVQSDLELVIWPLAVLHLIDPDPIVLLWVQDLAVAGCGLVTYWWVLDYLQQQHLPRRTTMAVAAGVLGVVVVDVGAWYTVSFDVHMEPIATLFLLLSGRDLWRGRFVRGAVFAAVVLVCGGFAAVMVIGLGVSALLAGRPTRRAGVALVAAGIAWIALIAVLHADEGSEILDYAYLAGRTTLPPGSLGLIAKGIVSHPGRVLHGLRSHWANEWDHLRAVGVVGVATAWGFGVPATVMFVTALDSHANFSFSSFQNFAVLPFVLLGTVMALVWLSKRSPRGLVAAALIGVVALGEAVGYGATQDPSTIRDALAVAPPAAVTALGRTLSDVPANAEVVSTIASMGRFAARPYCYRVLANFEVPVHASTVVFIFSTHHLELLSTARLDRAISYVRGDLHARLLVDSGGVTSLLWHPPARLSAIFVPTGPG